MRRLSLLALLPATALLLSTAAASADGIAAPLCLLAPAFERTVIASPTRDFVVGASVIDLRSGEQWTGGLDAPFAMHSAIKPAVAAAVIQDSHEQGWALHHSHRLAVYRMVAQSDNADVRTLLGLIGDMPGLEEYYRGWGVPELARLSHESWGASRATPSMLARLYAALAVSDDVPLAARGQVYSLLDDVTEIQTWGARLPSEALPGWQSLIKTGNFSVPADPQADDLRASEALGRRPGAIPDTPLAAMALQGRVLVRMNSAAIWLAEPWTGGEPRYVVVIMLEGFVSWYEAETLQEQLGAVLADALVARERDQPAPLASWCLRRALS